MSSPLCLLLTHSVILRTFSNRKGEQIFNLKLWKGSWRMDFWGTGRIVSRVSDVSVPELYSWRRTQFSGLFLHRHCTWFFFLKKLSFTLKSHRMYQWVKFTSSTSTALLFSECISRHGMENTWWHSRNCKTTHVF